MARIGKCDGCGLELVRHKTNKKNQVMQFKDRNGWVKNVCDDCVGYGDIY